MPSQHKYMFKKLKPTPKGKRYKDYALESIAKGDYTKDDFDLQFGDKKHSINNAEYGK